MLFQSSFEARFTRLEYVGEGKFNVAYMRHTDQAGKNNSSAERFGSDILIANKRSEGLQRWKIR